MTETARRLMVAFAHPDDEAFGVGGTMARLAADGWQVTVLCATRGEVGEIADPSLATPETLGQVREQELRDSCAVLGVHDVRFLGYRDSGMEGTPENADPRALCNADVDALANEIADVIRSVAPEVVVTWDLSGGYGHPDHIKVHHGATAGFRLAAAAPDGPSELYYTAMDTSIFEEIATELAKQGIAFGNEGMRERAQSLPRMSITTRIDVQDFIELKGKALLTHRTQMPADGFMQRVPDELRRRMLGTETFHRVEPAWHEGDPPEHMFSTAG